MKKFLVIGTLNAVAYKDVFPSIMQGNIWAGAHFNKSMYFEVPDNFVYSEKYKSDRERNGKKVCLVVGCGWFTNIGANNRPPIELTEHYNPEKYPHYDNYDAIEVSKVSDIPIDYDGVMGVPVTFMGKYCPEQFEIIGIALTYSWANYPEVLKKLGFNPNVKHNGGTGSAVLCGKTMYVRILIRRKNNSKIEKLCNI